MPKSIPNPNPNPNVQDVAKPTWAHPNVRDVAKPAWAHPNVLDVAEPAWAPTLAAKPPEECKTESAGRIVKKYLHPAAGRIDTGLNFSGNTRGRLAVAVRSPSCTGLSPGVVIVLGLDSDSRKKNTWRQMTRGVRTLDLFG